MNDRRRLGACLAIVSASSLCCGSLATNCGAGEPESITIAAVSCESRIRQTEFNLSRIEHWTSRAASAGADLVLFPECGIHGWWQSRENRRFAESTNGPSVQRLIQLAKKHDIIIAAGMTELKDGRAHITHLLLNGDGILGLHRKSSLAGGSEGEARVWEAGSDTNVVEIRGRTLGIAICFESVHPETCAELKNKNAEIILAPYANGTRPGEITDPERRQRRWVWDRVRENRVWYVACDATPHDSNGALLPGAAYIIDPGGGLVASTPGDNPGEAMVIHTIPVAHPNSYSTTTRACGNGTTWILGRLVGSCR